MNRVCIGNARKRQGRTDPPVQQCGTHPLHSRVRRQHRDRIFPGTASPRRIPPGRHLLSTRMQPDKMSPGRMDRQGRIFPARIRSRYRMQGSLLIRQCSRVYRRIRSPGRNRRQRRILSILLCRIHRNRQCSLCRKRSPAVEPKIYRYADLYREGRRVRKPMYPAYKPIPGDRRRIRQRPHNRMQFPGISRNGIWRTTVPV